MMFFFFFSDAAGSRTVSSKGKSCVNFVPRRRTELGGDAGRSGTKNSWGGSQEELEYGYGSIPIDTFLVG